MQKEESSTLCFFYLVLHRNNRNANAASEHGNRSHAPLKAPILLVPQLIHVWGLHRINAYTLDIIPFRGKHSCILPPWLARMFLSALQMSKDSSSVHQDEDPANETRVCLQKQNARRADKA